MRVWLLLILAPALLRAQNVSPSVKQCAVTTQYIYAQTGNGYRLVDSAVMAAPAVRLSAIDSVQLAVTARRTGTSTRLAYPYALPGMPVRSTPAAARRCTAYCVLGVGCTSDSTRAPVARR